MKLDRNINPNGRGKYALLKLRELDKDRDGKTLGEAPEIIGALAVLEHAGILDWGMQGTESEFFVIERQGGWT